MIRLASIPFLLVAILLSAPPEPYSGQYVFKVGGRNLIVLNVRQVNGRWTGTFARPQHADFGDSYSKISNTSITEPIASGVVHDGHLHLLVRDPAKQSDAEELDLEPVGNGADLKLSGTSLPRWRLVRVPETPLQDVGTGWDATCTYYPDELTHSSPEMTSIFEADQRDRPSWDEYKAHQKSVEARDRERRLRVRKLLDEHSLHTAEDFAHAAFIFQHGDTPDDYLLAHTLAMLAMRLGDRSSSWIASATLDRYLLAIKRPQIFATQMEPGSTDRSRTPVDGTLVPEYVRQQLGVRGPRK